MARALFVYFAILLLPVFAAIAVLALIAYNGYRNIIPLTAIVSLVLAQYLALGAYAWSKLPTREG